MARLHLKALNCLSRSPSSLRQVNADDLDVLNIRKSGSYSQPVLLQSYDQIIKTNPALIWGFPSDLTAMIYQQKDAAARIDIAQVISAELVLESSEVLSSTPVLREL